jgi:hypothetical protein
VLPRGKLVHANFRFGRRDLFRGRWNDGYRADSGPSRGDSCRRALRPTEASKAAICNGSFTSTPPGRNGQGAVFTDGLANGSNLP